MTPECDFCGATGNEAEAAGLAPDARDEVAWARDAGWVCGWCVEDTLDYDAE